MARMPVAGEVIDEVFRVEAEIDSGNFGSVYKVHDMLEDRILALKVLRPGPHDESELRQRFEREARLIYSLQHKHIVRVHFYGETNSGLPYMAMEYLEGTDLRTLLQHHGALNHALVRRITLETLSALSVAHDLGIIHRDLKPANIFLVKDGGKGHVKVLDFGFAKALDDSSPLAEITHAKTLVGTPAYMAPELVHKKRVGPAADLYAMGLIMAEMLKGDKIIEIDTVYDTILFQASPENIRFPDAIMGSPFADVVTKSTKKSLEERYETARQFGEDLGGLPQVEPTPEPEREKKAPVRRKLYITDAGDNDVTIPRSLGLPSEEELAALMGRSVTESDDKTIDWHRENIPDLDQKESTPLPHSSTDAHRVVRNTPQNARRAQESSRREQRSPVRGEVPGDGPDYQGPTRKRGALRRDSARQQSPLNRSARVPENIGGRDIGEVEITDLGRRPKQAERSSSAGIPEILLGVVLGALLLGLLLLVLYMNGTVDIR